MSYMGSIAMRGKSITGSSFETIMPSEYRFQLQAILDRKEESHEGPVHLGEPDIEVSSVYSAGPEVMDRK